MSQSPLIVLSAGGTGGHMIPAQALGHDLLSRGFRVELITDKRGLKFESMFSDIKIHVINSGTMGKGAIGKIRGLSSLGVGAIKALALVRKLKPALVVGFGGYPSVPGVFAAQRLGILTVVHEQNAVLGRANALMARKATRIALSWPETAGLGLAEKEKSVVTGNPVRTEIAALFTQPYPNMDQEIRIFVMGGSLGAKVFSDVVPKALANIFLKYRSKLHVVQQCREDDIEAVRALYNESGIRAELAPFFKDVPAQLARAHLLICRSGASTVAEVTAAGRPAIFVPYPHHKDQQQKKNAAAVANAGGAWVMTEDGFMPEALLAQIEGLLQDPSVLARTAEKARTFGKPDAARKFGNLVTEMIDHAQPA